MPYRTVSLRPLHVRIARSKDMARRVSLLLLVAVSLSFSTKISYHRYGLNWLDTSTNGIYDLETLRYMYLFIASPASLFNTHPLVCSFSQSSLWTHTEACSRLPYAFSFAGLSASSVQSGQIRAFHKTTHPPCRYDALQVTNLTTLPPVFFTACEKKLGSGDWERGY